MFQQSPDRLYKSIGLASGSVTKDIEHRWHRKGKRDKIAIRFSLALLLFVPFSLLFPSASNGAPLTYQTQTASQGDYDVTVYAGGLLQNKVYNLIFQSSSSNLVSEIDVRQGQKVVRGQVLGRLNAIPLQDGLDLANASVKVARANVSSALEYANIARASVDAKLHAAWVSVDVAQDNQNAVNEQSSTLKDATNDITQDDQKILDAQRKTARILIRHAEALRQQTIEICKVAQEAIFTATATAELTPIPTIALTGVGSSYPLTTSATDQNDDNTDNSAYSDCVKQARTQYALDVSNARTSVIIAQEQVDKDQQALDQVQATINVNNVNVQGQLNVANSLIDVAKTDQDYIVALTQVTADQGQLFIALTQVNIAKHNLANTIMVAPHDGVVTGINATIDGAPGVQPNSAINNGSAPLGVFIQLVDFSSPGQIIVNVTETDILKIKVGQPVQFTLKAFGYRAFSARVDAISPNGLNNTGTIDYPVFLDLDAKSLHGLKPYSNMSASAVMSVLHDHNVLMVPASAIEFSHMMSTSLNPLVSNQQMQNVQREADSMLSQLTQKDPKLAQQTLPPIATFVIEQTGNGNSQAFKARPVVLLGITNGESYEVLQGLMTGERLVTGIDNGKKTP